MPIFRVCGCTQLSAAYMQRAPLEQECDNNKQWWKKTWSTFRQQVVKHFQTFNNLYPDPLPPADELFSSYRTVNVNLHTKTTWPTLANFSQLKVSSRTLCEFEQVCTRFRVETLVWYEKKNMFRKLQKVLSKVTETHPILIASATSKSEHDIDVFTHVKVPLKIFFLSVSNFSLWEPSSNE